MSESKRLSALFAVAMATLAWSSSPVFIRYLDDAYDAYAQTLIRYVSAAIALILYSAVFYRRELFAVLRRPWAVGAVVIFNVLMQICWVEGIYRSTGATLPQLISRLTAVFVVVISYFLFHEERRVIRNPLFLLGTLISLTGLPLVLTTDPASLLPRIDLSAMLLVLAALFWSVYMIQARHAAKALHAVPLFAVVSVLTAASFAFLTFLIGNPGALVSAGMRNGGIAFLSGIIPIAIAHPTYYYAQKQLGASFCSSFLILLPIPTYLFGIMVLEDEGLRWSQWVGAAILLSGVAIVTRTSQIVHKDDPSEDARHGFGQDAAEESAES